MVKGLKDILGKAMGRPESTPEPDVIGAVEVSKSGNSILRLGRWLLNATWEQKGHVVLTSVEREELIEVLESHRDYHLIKVGDVIDGAFVIAVQYVNPGSDSRELRGTILTYHYDKREWTVLSASPQGDLNFGTRTPDRKRALDAYATRTTEHLYMPFATSPPVLTFADVAESDRLKSGT